jgi:hypothetical protein
MRWSEQHHGADAIKLSASFPGVAPPVRKGEPFTVGVPLPRGRFVPSQAWSIVGLEGSRRSVQTRALDCWSDGSVRWLLVDGNADLSPELQSVHLIPTTGEVRDVPAIGVMLVLPNRDVWTFEALDDKVELEDSVFLAGNDGPRRTAQIVIRQDARHAPSIRWSLVRSTTSPSATAAKRDARREPELPL